MDNCYICFHMPRTIALMQSRDLGNSIIFPYPTDFTSFNPKFNLKFSFNNIGRLDNLIHEISWFACIQDYRQNKDIFSRLKFDTGEL